MRSCVLWITTDCFSTADVQGFKTDIIMTMSHEMRTPLHAIIGESDNLEHLIKVWPYDLSSSFINEDGIGKGNAAG